MKVQRPSVTGPRQNISELQPGDFFHFDGVFYITQRIIAGTHPYCEAIDVETGERMVFTTNCCVTALPGGRIVLSDEEGGSR